MMDISGGSMLTFARTNLITSIFSIALMSQALAGTAPDATGTGPYATATEEYRLPAEIDPNVLAIRPTEVWARVYWPDPIPDNSPLLVFLHGNHATCGTCGSSPFIGYQCADGRPRNDSRLDYTASGTCPLTGEGVPPAPSDFIVSPSHEGYGYVAEQLASWGYLVVSINVNRGINGAMGIAGDNGLNLTRGKMVLKHLWLLSQWNQGTAPTPDSLGIDLTGKIDFSNVGLMGHSRGGEGQRAAYEQYRDTGSPWPDRIGPVTFKAIFEIGPVDGQTSRVLNADGTPWNVILPMCDGDVNDLQGVKPFDRMMRVFEDNPATQKSTYTVWGTCHNYYNTEWQLVEQGAACFGPGNVRLFSMPRGSPEQRQTSLASIMALFRGNVGPGADPSFNTNFNPLFALPAVVSDVTRVDRSYTDSPNAAVTAVFEDFTGASGTSQYGFTIDTSGLFSYTHGGVPNHSPVQRAALISWDAPGGTLQTNWTDAGTGTDISGYATLDLRASRQNSSLNPPSTSFSIQLVIADGSVSGAVALSNYTDLTGPVGRSSIALHPILQSARIPLADFGADLTQVSGVLFTFDDPSGAIYLANVRLSTVGTGVVPNPGQQSTSTLANAQQSPETIPVYSEGNFITQVRSSPIDGNQVVVEGYTPVNIPVTDSLLRMQIGEVESTLSEFVDGDTRRVAFTFDSDVLAQIPSGSAINVYWNSSSGVWKFGTFDARLIK
jgi:hypothetical protein